jgi:peptidoglycan/LPS O-acetylase OafA/YrhL
MDRADKDLTRLKPLDGMRGLAALAVAVFAHYQHFGGDHQTYPWATGTVTSWLYAHSWAFVDFFFLLSGIVLTYRYLDPISRGSLGQREFFVLRLSRLYPLQLLTLSICAAVQWRCLVLHKPEIIYDHSNLYHFFLNLVYLNSGGFEEAWAYNSPSWSVAVEVSAYLLFFIYASKSRETYITASLCTVVAGLAIIRMGWMLPILNGNMARGMIGFFVGSFIFLVVRRFKELGAGRWFAGACFAAMVGVFWLTYSIGYDAFVGGTTLPLLFVIFPLVIVSGLEVPILAQILSLRPFTFLGDLSYAVYLVHVPVQMVLISILRERGHTAPVATKWFFFQFVLVVLFVATVVHKLFEVPMRRWMRERLGSLQRA